MKSTFYSIVCLKIKGAKDICLCPVSPFSSNMFFVCAKGCSLGAKGGGFTRGACYSTGKDRASRTHPMLVNNEKDGANVSVSSEAE